MKFVHRIGLRATVAQRKELLTLDVKVPAGVTLPGGGDPLLAFDVDEDHPNWPTLAMLLRTWRVSDLLRTEFSKREIDAARWLEISAWHHGYPQPDEDVFGYRQVTYDLSNWCEQCGVGKKQKAPFQMKGEPKWGRNGILQLIWIYDELFVTPEVWSSIFKPHGIASRPVTNTKRTELKTVVQLVIEGDVGVVTEGMSVEQCAACGQAKLLPVTRGAFPPLTSTPTAAVVKTREYFGSGAQADRRVILSQDVARKFAAGEIRGASLKPVRSE